MFRRSKNGCRRENGDNKKRDIKSKVPLTALLRFADKADKIIFTIGILASVATGFSYPAANYLLALITNTIVCYVKNQNLGNATFSNYNASCNVTNQKSEFYCATNSKDVIEEARYLSICIAVIGVVCMMLSYLRVVCLEHTANNQVRITGALYAKSVLRQDIAWFEDRRTGQYALNSIEGLQKYKSGINSTMGLMVSTVTSCIVSFVMAFVYGWKLTLVCASAFCFIIVISATSAKLTASGTRRVMNSQTTAGNLVEEIQSALRTVIAFGGEETEVARFKEQLNVCKKSSIKLFLYDGVSFAIYRMVTLFGLGLATWYGLKLTADELCSSKPTYDTFTLTVVVFNIFFNCLGFVQVAPALQTISEAQISVSFLHNVIDQRPEIDSLSERGSLCAALRGTIEFHDVGFAYPSRPNVKVLDGLRLKGNAGETLAVIGESGSGKSTLTYLLQRFYQPTEGKVTLDGTDILDANVGSLRRHIGVVGQEPVLFSATIADNIRYGKENATSEDIEQAAKEALAHTFIEKLPKKYQTIIGGKESQLSGGQKQRIAIARALIGKPQILILDEATSALDYHNELQVFKSIRKAAKGATIIIITHRLNVVRYTDNICVIHKGKVAEMGNHANLVKAGGSYSKFLRKQEEHSVNINAPPSEADLENLPNIIHPKITQTSCASTQPGKEKMEIANIVIGILKESSPGLTLVLLASIILSVAYGTHTPISILLVSNNYDILTSTNDEFLRLRARKIAIDFIILTVATTIVAIFQKLSFAIYEANFKKSSQLKLFEIILKQDMAWLDKQDQNVGDIYTNMLYDVANVSNAMKACALLAPEYVTMLTAAIALCFLQSWKLGIVFLACVPILAFTHKIENIVVSKYSALEAQANKKTNTIVIEAISNIRTVASFHREKYILELLEAEMKILQRNSMKTANIQAVMCGVTESLVFFVSSAIIFYGTLLVTQGSLQFGQFFLVVRMVFVIAKCLTFPSVLSSSVDKGFVSAKKLIQKFNDSKPAMDLNVAIGIIPDFDACKSLLQLNNVRFSYPSRPEVQILKGIDITVHRGHKIGLTGPSGCGKSTIFQLFMRMYNPDKGTVNFAGEDVRLLNLKSLRSQIAIVSQEPTVFDRSILENIAYGDHSRNIPMDEIISAARSANIHDFISTLPDGYNTRVGDKGVFLSGGQKQRIAIARALVRNPKVLFLDEATSALDNENEKVVQKALEDAQVGRTCIIAAHRLSNITDCDVIFVINDGRIVAMGNHHELLNRKRLYRKLAVDANATL